MKILFRVLMGIAALVGYTHTILGTGSSTGGNQSDNDPMELIEYAGIALGAGASSDLQFTASLTGSVATMSSSLLPANTATQNNAITAANAIFEISIVSNKSAGFTVELKSTNDGNFNRGDAGACLSETGTGDGTAGDNSDALCITYEIECNDITHDETNAATLTTLFNSDVGTAGEWMKLETTDGTAYTTVTDAYPGFANYPEAEVDSLTPLYCDLRFSTDEDAAEISDGTYADTITLTYVPN